MKVKSQEISICTWTNEPGLVDGVAYSETKTQNNGLGFDPACRKFEFRLELCKPSVLYNTIVTEERNRREGAFNIKKRKWEDSSADAIMTSLWRINSVLYGCAS